MPRSRIRLLEATPGDAEEIVQTIDPAAMQNFEMLREKVTVERERKYLEEMYASSSDYFYLIRRADTGALLGAVGLHDVDAKTKSARIGISLFRTEFRGQGYGTVATQAVLEIAFGNLRLQEVYVNVFADNTRAQIRNARFGFRQSGIFPGSLDGILRGYYELNGEKKDMLHMTLCRCRWEDLRAEKGER